jgi:glycerate dehydrogenase
MKIVVLDGMTLNPGDLSWGPLEALGAVKVYPRTALEEIVPRAQHAEIVLTNKTPLNRETIRHLAALKYIGVLATGHNVVNVEAARKRGVVVTNVPGYSTASVAQHTFALLLELATQTGHHAHTVRQGRWSKQPDFCYWLHPMLELAGLTMGLIGYGQIGKAVARIAQGFGMSVLIHTPHPPHDLPAGVRAVTLEELLAGSDVVSLHCPLAPVTEKIINESSLARMKPGAILINTSRGGLVDEEALLNALRSGHLRGAGLDVLNEEPPDIRNPLLRARGCLVTPHLAWGTLAARQRLMDEVVANVKSFVDGQPRNVIAVG